MHCINVFLWRVRDGARYAEGDGGRRSGRLEEHRQQSVTSDVRSDEDALWRAAAEDGEESTAAHENDKDDSYDDGEHFQTAKRSVQREVNVPLSYAGAAEELHPDTTKSPPAVIPEGRQRQPQPLKYQAEQSIQRTVFVDPATGLPISPRANNALKPMPVFTPEQMAAQAARQSHQSATRGSTKSRRAPRVQSRSTHIHSNAVASPVANRARSAQIALSEADLQALRLVADKSFVPPHQRKRLEVQAAKQLPQPQHSAHETPLAEAVPSPTTFMLPKGPSTASLQHHRPPSKGEGHADVPDLELKRHQDERDSTKPFVPAEPTKLSVSALKSLNATTTPSTQQESQCSKCQRWFLTSQNEDQALCRCCVAVDSQAVAEANKMIAGAAVEHHASLPRTRSRLLTRSPPPAPEGVDVDTGVTRSAKQGSELVDKLPAAANNMIVQLSTWNGGPQLLLASEELDGQQRAGVEGADTGEDRNDEGIRGFGSSDDGLGDGVAESQMRDRAAGVNVAVDLVAAEGKEVTNEDSSSDSSCTIPDADVTSDTASQLTMNNTADVQAEEAEHGIFTDVSVKEGNFQHPDLMGLDFGTPSANAQIMNAVSSAFSGASRSKLFANAPSFFAPMPRKSENEEAPQEFLAAQEEHQTTINSARDSALLYHESQPYPASIMQEQGDILFPVYNDPLSFGGSGELQGHHQLQLPPGFAHQPASACPPASQMQQASEFASYAPSSYLTALHPGNSSILVPRRPSESRAVPIRAPPDLGGSKESGAPHDAQTSRQAAGARLQPGLAAAIQKRQQEIDRQVALNVAKSPAEAQPSDTLRATAEPELDNSGRQEDGQTRYIKTVTVSFFGEHDATNPIHSSVLTVTESAPIEDSAEQVCSPINKGGAEDANASTTDSIVIPPDAVPPPSEVQASKKNKEKQKQRKKARKALDEAWIEREKNRARVAGTFTLEDMAALVASTIEYKTLRDDLMSYYASGELPAEITDSYPSLAEHDLRAPKVTPSGVHAIKGQALGPGPGPTSSKTDTKKSENARPQVQTHTQSSTEIARKGAAR